MTELIKEMSESLAAVVETTGQKVVRVEGRHRLPASGVIWSEEGIIATVHHVLEQDKDIRVGLPDGGTVAAEIVGRDPTTDLAALRVQQGRFQPAKWVDPDKIKVGHLVLALGKPGALVQATLGIVSALGDSWTTSAGGNVEHYLQTDVVMYPGFSGGPLVSVSGDILGVNTSALRGVSVAIPTPTVQRVVESLLSHGRVRRGYLGVGLQPVRLPNQVSREIDQEIGLMVVSVEANGPAEAAGVTLGDTLLALNGEPTPHMDDLMRSLGPDLIDSEVTLQVLRGGKLKNLKIKIGERL